MGNRTNPPSPLWIILYITLHLLWRQFVPGGGFLGHAYLILPFSFLAAFIFIQVKHGRRRRILQDLVGRWLPRRADLLIGVAFIVATLLLRVLLAGCFAPTPEPRQLAVVADLAVLAPLNEELIFRGLFLGILLTRLPRHPALAVVWSAAIFLGFHSYPGRDVPAVAGVFSLGLLCGAAYATTQCVPLCILCHTLFNVLGWWTDVPRPMGVLEFLLGLIVFIFGAGGIGWLLQRFIRKKRGGGHAQRRVGA